MSIILKRAVLAAAVLATASFTFADDAHARVQSRHIGSGDTYVEVYAPRMDPESKQGAGYYIERHYNFAAEQMIERFFGEQSLQVVTTPFSTFGDRVEAAKKSACATADEQKADSSDAKDFLAAYCKK